MSNYKNYILHKLYHGLKLFGFLKLNNINLQLKLKVQMCVKFFYPAVAELGNMPDDEGAETKADTVLSRKLKKVSYSTFPAPCLYKFTLQGS